MTAANGDVRAAGEAELGRRRRTGARGGGLRDEGRRAAVPAARRRLGRRRCAGGRCARRSARGAGVRTKARSHPGGASSSRSPSAHRPPPRARTVEAGEVLRGEAGLGAIRAHALDARLAARDGGERRGDAHDLPAALERRPVDRHGGGHRRGRARAEEPRRDLSARDGGEKSFPRTRQFIRLVCHQLVNSAPADGPGPSSFLHLLPPPTTPPRARPRVGDDAARARRDSRRLVRPPRRHRPPRRGRATRPVRGTDPPLARRWWRRRRRSRGAPRRSSGPAGGRTSAARSRTGATTSARTTSARRAARDAGRVVRNPAPAERLPRSDPLGGHPVARPRRVPRSSSSSWGSGAEMSDAIAALDTMRAIRSPTNHRRRRRAAPPTPRSGAPPSLRRVRETATRRPVVRCRAGFRVRRDASATCSAAPTSSTRRAGPTATATSFARSRCADCPKSSFRWRVLSRRFGWGGGDPG